MNEQLLLLVNGWRGPIVDSVMRYASLLGEAWNGLILLAILLVCILWRPSLKRFVMLYAPAYGISAILSNVLKDVFERPRPPFALPGKVQLIDTIPASYSFPSGHATFTACLLVLCWPNANAWQRALLVGFVLLVGVSRLSLGAHFPVDVLAGWALGGGIAWIVTQGQTARRVV